MPLSFRPRVLSYFTLFWINLLCIYKGCFCEDAVFYIITCWTHVCPVCPPGPCLWGWNLLSGLLTEAQSDEFQDRKTSDAQRDVRTRKQTGCTETGLPTVGRQTLSLLQPATRWQSRHVRLTCDFFYFLIIMLFLMYRRWLRHFAPEGKRKRWQQNTQLSVYGSN